MVMMSFEYSKYFFFTEKSCLEKKGHIFNVLKYFFSFIFSSQLIILWGQKYHKLDLGEILIRIASEQDNKGFVL